MSLSDKLVRLNAFFLFQILTNAFGVGIYWKLRIPEMFHAEWPPVTTSMMFYILCLRTVQAGFIFGYAFFNSCPEESNRR